MTPQLQTERRLIGACIAGGPVCVAGAVGLGVSVESFTSQDLAVLWSGLTTAATEDKNTGSFYVLRRAFGTNIQPEHVERIREICEAEPTSIYAKDLANALVGETKRRKVVFLLNSAVHEAKSASDWDSAWSATSQAIMNAQETASANVTTADLESLVDAYIAEETNGKAPGIIGTGIPELDDGFGRIARGEVCVLAGRPGVGKTALALQMAAARTFGGGSAMVVSLEMSGKELIGRLAKQRAGRAGAITRGCSKEDFVAAKEARIESAKKIKGVSGRLHIFEVKEAATLSRIEDRLAMLCSAAKAPDVLVIDYLQLIQPDDTRAPREQQVASMSRRIKLLALRFNLPVLLLSQLNRDAEKNDRRPRLSDLRESGAIEQDADRVWLLYPDAEQPAAADSPTVAVLIDQAKNRNGISGIAKPARFYKPAFLFEKP